MINATRVFLSIFAGLFLALPIAKALDVAGLWGRASFTDAWITIWVGIATALIALSIRTDA